MRKGLWRRETPQTKDESNRPPSDDFGSPNQRLAQVGTSPKNEREAPGLHHGEESGCDFSRLENFFFKTHSYSHPSCGLDCNICG